GALGVGGWHTPFWVYAISIVIAVPMIFALWEPKAASGEPAVAVAEKTPIPWRRILVPLLVTVFGGFSFYVMIIEVSYLLVSRGIDASNTAVIGAVSAVASLATAIGGLTFARVAKRGVRLLLPLAFALQAVGMILLWVVPGVPGIAIGAVVASFGSGLLLPSLLMWVVATTEFAERGRVTGWWTAAFFLGEFLTPILMGILGGVTGVLSAGVGVVGIAAAVIAVLVALALRRDAAKAPSVA
ncbi:MAG: MFS transporter, partial [Microbacterium sp.]|nr:MFS transporter [Microbacterium sp.]